MMLYLISVSKGFETNYNLFSVYFNCLFISTKKGLTHLYTAGKHIKVIRIKHFYTSKNDNSFHIIDHIKLLMVPL